MNSFISDPFIPAALRRCWFYPVPQQIGTIRGKHARGQKKKKKKTEVGAILADSGGVAGAI